MSERLILLTAFTGVELDRLMVPFSDRAEIRVASTREQFDQIPLDERTTLLSFGTGIIVPVEMLGRLRRPAYNLHAASPEFPGRDPHHHAIYRGAKTYGATLHVMTEQVDAGPIVAVETFPVGAGATPMSLLAAANEAGLRLIERIGAGLLSRERLPPLPDVVWGSTKTTRADLLHMCELTPFIDEEEFERRYRAFDGGAFNNLRMTLHGRTFRIDKQNPTKRSSSPANEEFTERAFGDMLGQLKNREYRFARYGDATHDRHVIWRHDVDFSMHRAARLADIEAREGAVATYFVNPRSAFYNLFEPEIATLVRKIADLGHEIGIHFDAAAYSKTMWTEDTLLPALARERKLLEMLLETPVRTVSWHNPDQSNLLSFDAEEVGGLVNAYSARLKRDYVYCSDSNGYWRFKPIPQVIDEGHERLHLLTHPAWWTPEAIAPSERVDRAILGRARKVRREYDKQLAVGGRKNIV
jgi:methionyl-tRNA formyltransferase